MARRRVPDVLVLMGGASGEHDVSLASGAAVWKALDRARVTPHPIIVSRDNARWAFAAPGEAEGAEGLPVDRAIGRIRRLKPAAAFLAMHGPFGEDGRMQALLDLLGVPYVGSDHVASALAMDKAFANAIYRAAGIPTPKALDLVLGREGGPADLAARVRKAFPAPWVLKTPRLGSSVGVEIVAAGQDLEAALARVAAIDGRVLAEEFVAGREFTVPVLDLVGEGAPRALPIIEIVPVGSTWFDYQTKYDDTRNREICPAEITPDLGARLQDLGLRAHAALGCRGISRTDVLVTPGGAAYVLETNTLPGLTPQSLFPKAARAVGIDYAELVTRLVEDAIARAERR